MQSINSMSSARTVAGRSSALRGLRWLLLPAVVLPLLTACDGDPNRPDPFTEQEVGVVVNSVELSLTIFPADDPAAARAVGLGAAGSPVSAAFRNGLAAVPMGIFPALVVVDLADASVLRTIALPEGSGATGVAFLNDSIALVSNPDLNSVSPVNVQAGTTGAQIATGAYPGAILVRGNHVFIVNSELENFQPARSGTLTVLDRESLEIVETIELGGENSSGITEVDGTLYVVNSGRWGEANGSLSVVDPETRTEIAHHEGFGDFPGGVAGGSGGRIHVTSYGYGLSVWDSASGDFVRAPAEAVSPGGVPSASGVALDSQGRVHVVAPGDCQAPSQVFRLAADLSDELEIPVGICPVGIGFTGIEVALNSD